MTGLNNTCLEGEAAARRPGEKLDRIDQPALAAVSSAKIETEWDDCDAFA